MVTFSIVERREQQHCLLPSTYLERAKQRVHKKKKQELTLQNKKMYVCMHVYLERTKKQREEHCYLQRCSREKRKQRDELNTRRNVAAIGV